MLKKRYLFLIMLVCLSAISAVSAEEISNETNIVANDYDSSLITESVNEDILTDSYGTFQELQEEINAVEEGGTLNLTRNYKYVNGSKEGIEIFDKSITIDGKGYTLNGNYLARILHINGNYMNVTLKNIKFINGLSVDYDSFGGNGGAIHWYTNNGLLINCTFINCSSKFNGGGALSLYGSSKKILNSTFINCSAMYGGGAIISNGDYTLINNCTFINDSTDSYGGAIHFNSNYGNVNNSKFLNCNSKNGNGGAIYWSNTNIYFVNPRMTNCSFDNCSSLYDGGALHMSANNGTIINCSFNNCSFTRNTIFWYGDDGNIINCLFTNPEEYNINSPYNELNVVKRFSKIESKNYSFFYKNVTNVMATLSEENFNLINKKVIFTISKGTDEFKYYLTTDENGRAILNNLNLSEGVWNLDINFKGNDNYYSSNTTVTITILSSISSLTIDDVNTTVGHETTLIAHVSSNLTINEGTVTFFDGKNQIGESQVTNGKATLTYTPTTAGEHTITAIFNSDNYLSSNDTSVLSVKKANIDLTIADIAPVLFTNPSNFAVNVNSNYKAVNEGKIKYYVNNDLVGTTTVNGGVANLDYVTNITGSFILVAVYDETSNYLSSNATATFTVNKMPTVLSAESVIFDEKGDKTFTTDLKDDNSIGVFGQNVKIETIKYSGESKTFNGITNIDGIAEYNVKNLEGGMWFVTGTYDGNGNYINSKFSDKFIVIRMDTTTNITGIDDNPKVNHTYKLKANIHDENGKLVKEGIVQFYLDGVDIGSIDLSKNKLSINDELLGISNLIFDYRLGDDDSDLYIEYTPSKAGTYTLSAVYEGTTVYRTSNETTTLIVKEDSPFNVSAPDVTKYYGGPERFIVTLNDLNGNPIKNAVVKITINGRPSNRTTDDNGIASMGINLNSGVYITTTEYNGTKVNSTVTVKDTVIAKDFSKIFRNGTQYNGTFVDSQGNLIKNTDVKININGVFYTRTTDANGVAKMNINLNPGTYVLTATNPASGEQHTTVITVLPSIVENHDLTKYYRNESKYTLRILDGNGKPVGEGVTVKLNINGVFYERKTNASGYINMNINLIPGTYIVTAEYNGLRASNTVKVLPVLSAKDVNMKYRDGTKFEAKLLNGKGNPFANQKITFNINGVFYERITDANGIARLNINLMAGEYIITSMYENGAALSNKVTISS